MLELFRCLAESAFEANLRELLDDVPGGKFVCGLVERTCEKYRKRVKEDKHHADMENLAQAGYEQAAEAARQAIREALPSAAVPPNDDDIILLELVLTAVPEAARQSLKRPADPTGRTAPAGFALREPDDLVKIYPVRVPRFRAGDALPGKPGWRLEKPLGLGGFGEVWLARHAAMRSLHGAAKFYFDQHGRDLIREAELIDRVMHAGGHPNIVPLKDVHLEGPTPWLLFEYVEGGNLADRLHALAAMPDAERVAQGLAALKQIAAAAAHVHGLTPPLVHRDLKPANVLYDRAHDRYRVTDFGIGAVTAAATLKAESQRETTRAGRLQADIRGSHTPLYASTEQRNGSPPSPQDDVHAWGVIAHQLFVGRLNAEPRGNWPKELRAKGVPADVIDLIGDCCAENPAERPKDAAEVLRRLSPATTGAVVPPPPPPPATPVVPPTPPPATTETHYVPIAGTWFSRPADQPEAEWVAVCATPAYVETSTAEAYRLRVTLVTADADLSKLDQLTGIPDLTSLDLTFCDQVTDAGVGQVAAKLAGLTSLSLYGCRQVTDAGVGQVATELAGLTSLDLPPSVTDAGVEQVAAKLAGLTWLSLSQTQVTDAGVGQVAAKLAGLTSLDLSYSAKVTDAGVGQVAAKLTGLTTLWLLGCNKVTPAAIERLKQALPNCKVCH